MPGLCSNSLARGMGLGNLASEQVHMQNQQIGMEGQKRELPVKFYAEHLLCLELNGEICVHLEYSTSHFS